MKYLSLFLVLILFSCGEESQEKNADVNWTQEQSTVLSKNLAIQEEIDIKLFLEMHKDWKMEKTGSGLQYYVYKHEGNSDYIPKEKDWAQIEYTISLLDGTECYKTEEDELENVRVDKSEIETGVQEALKILKIGDHAKLIVPSHIGHGLIGDMNKIPPLTPLVIDIHLIGIRR